MIEIFDIQKVGDNKLKLIVDDPHRLITKLPGLVRIKDIAFNTLLLKHDKSAIIDKLNGPMRIRGYSKYGNLQVITIEPDLSSSRLTIAATAIETAVLTRVGGEAEGPEPDVDVDGNEEDPWFPETDEEKSYTTIYIAVGVIGAIALIYWYYKGKK